jgi:hypothetical protein
METIAGSRYRWTPKLVQTGLRIVDITEGVEV